MLNVIVLCLDTNVQCFIQWSSGLDDHFANQSKELPFGDTYQYFGNRDGVLRFYPCTYVLRESKKR